MNTGRLVAAVVGVWIVRVILNATFYTQVVGGQFQELSAAHPGMFREVVPAFIATDLIFAIVFGFLFAKVGVVMGGGLQGRSTARADRRHPLPGDRQPIPLL